MNIWYLSFVNHGKFAGGCILEASTLETAIQKAWGLKINPGGEVVGILLSPDLHHMFPHNRLMSRAELESYAPMVRRGDME